MDRDSNSNASPKRRSKRVIILCLVTVALVALVIALTSDPFDSTSPIAIRLTRPIKRSSPNGGPTNVLVPGIEITNICDRTVMLSMRLKCQSNGQWIAWPAHVPDANDIYSSIELANWKTTLGERANVSTYPRDIPASLTTNLVRVHGFLSKEKTGVSKFGERVRTHFEYHNSKDPNLRKMAWDPYFKTFPAPTEFVTAPFYVTNELTPLNVEVGPRPIGR